MTKNFTVITWAALLRKVTIHASRLTLDIQSCVVYGIHPSHLGYGSSSLFNHSSALPFVGCTVRQHREYDQLYILYIKATQRSTNNTFNLMQILVLCVYWNAALLFIFFNLVSLFTVPLTLEGFFCFMLDHLAINMTNLVTKYNLIHRLISIFWQSTSVIKQY